MSPNAHALALDDELVDDRELDDIESDSFGHADFVRELARLVLATRMPANIALYGAWGSGKSSIARLLGKELPKEKEAVRFVIFDAWKYAETPLRRHFISQVASTLEIKDDEFREGLYLEEQGRKVKFGKQQWADAARTTALVFLLPLALALAIATGRARDAHGISWHGWWHSLSTGLLAAGGIASVLLGVVKFLADGFKVTTRKTAPSGDEEFERLFKQLVKRAETKRLVVFIDELDRCSPKQVVSVLETLKTFVSVDGCVFIVGADQQVLERALRERARQPTPEDVANPYYSSGSAYLDKVFQYQLSIPPMRSPALSRYALGLITGRPGVWKRVPDLPELVSVLIPTHVVSPRRVKVLLNRFAIAYRLA
jgi:Cdc6-like AAA superfamily ATPase